MSDQRRAVVIYGYGVDAVVEALCDLDSQYVLADQLLVELRQVPILRCRNAAQADAVREAACDVRVLVVELYRAQVRGEHACEPLLALNTAKVDPGLAARAIDQPDLLTWYAIFSPVGVSTVDGGPAADDHSNLTITVPDGHRMVAHAVAADGAAPPCLQGADQVLPSHDLWALARLRNAELCSACLRRHS